MTLILRSTNGAIAANPTGFRPPVTRGLVGWWFHGGDAARTRKNLWVPDGSMDATVVGSPTYSAHSARFKGFTNFLQTPFVDTANITLIQVASSPATMDGIDKPFFIGNFVSSSQGGANIFALSGTPSAAVIAGGADFGAAIRNGTVTVPDLTVPRILVNTVTEGVGPTMRDETAGLSGTFETTADREVGGGGAIRIGSGYNAGYTGDVDAYCSVIYDVDLTTLERAAMAAYLRGYYGRRSITV
ncbi:MULTISPECIES: hypothetical protein [Roseomonadaceae]|uniref:Uncharacterized protein n=1 Tax=Falsiroseomonas oleicola TaxID=2801474 RepID=A0ABS6H5P4_9PROT|nr:hypothetical protein [Roseomonas oleicola]MBU8544007.1 hypothetical protein [Roseomonas oleicola]